MKIFRKNEWLDYKDNNLNKILFILLFLFTIIFFLKGFTELTLPLSFKDGLLTPLFMILFSIIIFRNKKFPVNKNKFSLALVILTSLFSLFLLLRYFNLI